MNQQVVLVLTKMTFGFNLVHFSTEWKKFAHAYNFNLYKHSCCGFFVCLFFSTDIYKIKISQCSFTGKYLKGALSYIPNVMNQMYEIQSPIKNYSDLHQLMTLSLFFILTFFLNS